LAHKNRQEQTEWQEDISDIVRLIPASTTRNIFWQFFTLRDFHDRINTSFDATAKVIVTETRYDDFANNSTCDCVRHHPFQPVADFDAEFTIVADNQQDCAIVEAFLTDFPSFGDSNVKVF